MGGSHWQRVWRNSGVDIADWGRLENRFSSCYDLVSLFYGLVEIVYDVFECGKGGKLLSLL